MEELYSDNRVKLYWGDVFECLEHLPKNTIQAVITSPTYWGKRRFTTDKREFGSEKLEDYIDKNVRLFSSLLDLMKVGGSIFVVIQDTYMGSGVSRSHHNHWEHNKDPSYRRIGLDSEGQGNVSSVTAHHPVIKNKSLSGIPYRIALKLVDMGYVWRQQIIWEKPNPMPENIKDRVRQSAEYILHFTNNSRYKFYPKAMMIRTKDGKLRLDNQVWVASTEPKKGHTATFPRKIVERLLLGVTDKDDVVFDPFLGSGTMLNICIENQRKFIGCDINKKFVEESAKRVKSMGKSLKLNQFSATR
jgi:site-specific DNA-methyltransferase (adenine-specific)